MRDVVVSLFAVAALSVGASSAQAATITSFDIAGTTTGCFGTGCTNFTDVATSSPFTFDGTAFTATTDETGALTDIVLGTLSRNGNFTGSQTFRMNVTFTVPTGVSGSPETFQVVFTGQAGTPTNLDFDNTAVQISFSNIDGEGSFYFNVTDLSHLTRNGSQSLFGNVSGATMNTGDPGGGTVGTEAITTVPEPASLLLLSAGLAGLAAHRRRAKR